MFLVSAVWKRAPKKGMLGMEIARRLVIFGRTDAEVKGVVVLRRVVLLKA